MSRGSVRRLAIAVAVCAGVVVFWIVRARLNPRQRRAVDCVDLEVVRKGDNVILVLRSVKPVPVEQRNQPGYDPEHSYGGLSSPLVTLNLEGAAAAMGGTATVGGDPKVAPHLWVTVRGTVQEHDAMGIGNKGLMLSSYEHGVGRVLVELMAPPNEVGWEFRITDQGALLKFADHSYRLGGPKTILVRKNGTSRVVE